MRELSRNQIARFAACKLWGHEVVEEDGQVKCSTCIDGFYGEVVTGIFLNKVKDEEMLYLATDRGGGFLFEFFAECCSETWVADIIGVDNLVNKVGQFIREVTTAEGISMPDPCDGRSRQESDEVFGLRFRTSQGTCEIIFRNSSNGYYGGSYSFKKLDTALDVTGWKEITEDFQG